MGICMMCHKKIPDGKTFCDECEQNRNNQADESYLDSLLNSVSADSLDAMFANPLLKRKEKPEKAAPKQTEVKKESKPEPVISGESETSLDDLLAGIGDDSFSDNELFGIDDEDQNSSGSALFGDDNEDLLNSSDNGNESNMSADEMNAMFADMAKEFMNSRDNEAQADSDQSPDVDLNNDEMNEMLDDLFADMDAAGQTDENQENNLQEGDIDDIFGSFGMDESDDEPLIPSKRSQDDMFEESQPESQDIDIDALSGESLENLFEEGPIDDQDNDKNVVDIDWSMMGEAVGSTSDDSITDLFEEVNDDNKINVPAEAESLLNDNDQLLNQVMDDIENGDYNTEGEQNTNSKAQKEKRKSKDKKPNKLITFLKKIFSNVEMTEKEIEAEKKKEEDAEKKKQDKIEAAQKNAERKKEMAAAAKIKEREQAEAKKRAAEAAKAKKAAAALEKEKKKKEAALAIAEYEVDHGKINKAGATILFVIFAIITIVIIIGTNIYSYNLSIANAQDDFDKKHYNEAYYDVYGLDIRDEDVLLNDRIMTVMYVNTQLNSYSYYMKSNNTEKALDSLIKGLQRYEKYYNLAKQLDITDDLNYVKDQILDILATEFNMDEKEAYSLIDLNDNMDYSMYIYTLLGTYEEELKNMEN